VINITIDGRKLRVPEGWTILEAARENGIEIPTLCYHEVLEPYGACRLCVVELERGSRSQLVASCVYPCEEGTVVHTDSEMVHGIVRTVSECNTSLRPDETAVERLIFSLPPIHLSAL